MIIALKLYKDTRNYNLHAKLSIQISVSLLTYLILNFVLFLEVEIFDVFSFVVKLFWKKSSTGVAKMNKKTAVTSNAPVPTNVCFSSLMTGLT